MYLLTHSLSPVLVLVVVMGSVELKTSRLFSCSFSDSLSDFKMCSSHADSLCLKGLVDSSFDTHGALCAQTSSHCCAQVDRGGRFPVCALSPG